MPSSRGPGSARDALSALNIAIPPQGPSILLLSSQTAKPLLALPCGKRFAANKITVVSSDEGVSTHAQDWYVEHQQEQPGRDVVLAADDAIDLGQATAFANAAGGAASVPTRRPGHDGRFGMLRL